MAIKKKWYDIVSPEMLGSKVIGETPAIDADQLLGRTVETNTIELFGDHSRFFIKIQLKIKELDGDKAKTEFIGHNCQRDRIYRMIRKGSTKVEIVDKVETKDGEKIRIKVVVSLPSRVKTNVQGALRESIINAAQERASELSFKEFTKNIIDGVYGKHLRDIANKIYPVAGFEIRKSEVLKPGKNKTRNKENKEPEKEKQPKEGVESGETQEKPASEPEKSVTEEDEKKSETENS